MAVQTKVTDATAWQFCHSPEGVPCHLRQITVGCFPWRHGQRFGECPRGSMHIGKFRVPHSASTVKPSFTLSLPCTNLGQHQIPPDCASDLCPREIRQLVTSSPRVSACALCCNIATYRPFQFEFISCHIVWTAYNHNVIRSYRHHRKNFDLNSVPSFSKPSQTYLL